MTAGLVLAICGIISYLAFRNNFFGLKLMAGMSWIAFFIYLKSNPPAGITEGSTIHAALLVIIIGFGLMIVLSGLGRGITRSQRNTDGNFEVKQEGGFDFHMPDWLKDQESPEYKRMKTSKHIEEYRGRLKKVLRTGNYSSKRK